MDVKLIVVKGKAKGRTIPLPSTVITIGRDKKCHLRPHCPLVSKMHCAIACWAGKVVVRDLKSSNGTFVNGARVEGEIRIHDGDKLQVGTLEFVFRIQATEESLPIQVVFPSEVQWLIDKKDAAAPLLPSETLSVPTPAGLFETTGAWVGPAGSGPELSAGDQLREYLRKPK